MNPKYKIVPDNHSNLSDSFECEEVQNIDIENIPIFFATEEELAAINANNTAVQIQVLKSLSYR